MSESLENLELGKKGTSSSKQSDIKNTLKRHPNDETSTSKQAHRLTATKQAEEKERGESKERGSARKEEREESLEKIEIRWEKKKKNPYDLSR